MDYQKMILVGNVSAGPQVQKSKKGDITFTTFSVGVSDGKESTSFFPVAAFRKLGEIIAKHVKKGRQVLVEGRIQVTDKGRFNVIADRIRFGAQPAEPKATQKSIKKK